MLRNEKALLRRSIDVDVNRTERGKGTLYVARIHPTADIGSFADRLVLLLSLETRQATALTQYESVCSIASLNPVVRV